jgi:hypothetical protein
LTGGLHAERLRDLSIQFRDFLTHQTNIELVDTEAVGADRGPDALLAALERLDAALSQIADLQSVYSDSATGALDSVAFPVAVLVGEYIRATLGGEWREPDDPHHDDTLVITLHDGQTLDLFPVVRAAILSGSPNLARIVRA